MNTIQNQTLTDIEIICIDDASTDGSGDMLDALSKEDKRIVVYHIKEAIGAAQARNIGLELATSPYVIFLDADDLFEFDMLYQMYNQIEKYQADISIANSDVIDMTQKWSKNNSNISFYIENRNFPFKVLEASADILIKLSTEPWNKMIRKTFLLSNDIRFQNIEAANDVYFSILSYLLASKMIYIDSPLPKIHYRTNTNMQISSRRTPFHAYQAFKYIKEDLIKRNIW